MARSWPILPVVVAVVVSLVMIASDPTTYCRRDEDILVSASEERWPVSALTPPVLGIETVASSTLS